MLYIASTVLRDTCYNKKKYKKKINARARTYIHTHIDTYMCNSSGRERRRVVSHFFTINYIPRQGKGVTFQTAASVALFPRLDVAFTKLNEIKPTYAG